MELAIIDFAGKQFMVKPGDRLTVPGTFGEPESTLTINQVLLTHGPETQVGMPSLSTPVTLKVVSLEKSDKIRVMTYRHKSRYRKTRGHRQAVTVLEVLSLGAAPKASAKKTTAKSK